MGRRYVWVVEIGIFNSNGNKILYYEPWCSFNTRGEACDERDKMTTGYTERYKRVSFRIIKYVPMHVKLARAQEDADGKS